MRPKEKAKEIINKHYSNLVDFLTHYQAYKLAKQCALICIDNLQDELIKLNSDKSLDLFNYYQDVKQEINKI